MSRPRFDDPAAPAADLLAARRATAEVARAVGLLRDADLTAARRRTLSRICYEARALAEALAEALEGGGASMTPDPARITWGETLAPHALRSLWRHTSVHLNVTWRDLEPAGWARVLPDMPVAATPLWRADQLRAALPALALTAQDKAA